MATRCVLALTMSLMCALVLAVASSTGAECVGGECSSDDAEAAAMLQVQTRANTTETSTYTCYPTPGKTCGKAENCYLDKVKCSASGGGTCCKAAGDVRGLEQCRVCPCFGEPCPTSPSPSPTPAPSSSVGKGGKCGNNPRGPAYGSCASGLVCVPPESNLYAQTICRVPVTEGGRCGVDYYGRDLGACSSGHVCASPVGRPSEAPICQKEVAEGSQCGNDYYGNNAGACAKGFVCAEPPGRPGYRPICQVDGTVGIKSYCGGSYGACKVGLICAPPHGQPSAHTICQNVAGAGESCGINYKGDMLGICASGLVCSQETMGVCQAR